MLRRPKLTQAAIDGLRAVRADCEVMLDEREGCEAKPDLVHNGRCHRGIAYLDALIAWHDEHQRGGKP